MVAAGAPMACAQVCVWQWCQRGGGSGGVRCVDGGGGYPRSEPRRFDLDVGVPGVVCCVFGDLVVPAYSTRSERIQIIRQQCEGTSIR